MNGSIGLKRTKAHLSRALDKCGVRGTELEIKLTSFQCVKDGICDLAASQVVKQQMVDGIHVPPMYALKFLRGISKKTLRVQGSMLIPLLKEISVVLDSEKGTDATSSAVLHYRLDHCLARMLAGAAPASKTALKDWQTSSLEKGDVLDFQGGEADEAVLGRFRSFVALHNPTEAPEDERDEADANLWGEFAGDSQSDHDEEETMKISEPFKQIDSARPLNKQLYHFFTPAEFFRQHLFILIERTREKDQGLAVE